ncbi:hypothetical protein V2J09_018520 [Rumex salicifolius]
MASNMLNKIQLRNPYDIQTLIKFLMIKSEISIITWNAQEAGSMEFMITLKEIIRINNPTILVLVETRMSGDQVDKVCNRVGFDGIMRVEAIGKAIVNLQQIDIHQQVITLEVCRNGEDSWLFSTVYASPSLTYRKSFEECTGNSGTMRCRCEKFQVVRTLTLQLVDHFDSKRRGCYMTNFKTLWLNIGRKAFDLLTALSNLTVHLQAWNKDVFGNLFHRRDRLWKRIEGIQKKFCGPAFASGPDGFHALFFQANWKIIHKEVEHLALQVLAGV